MRYIILTIAMILSSLLYSQSNIKNFYYSRSSKSVVAQNPNADYNYFQVEDLSGYIKFITSDGKIFLVRKTPIDRNLGGETTTENYYTINVSISGNGNIVVSPIRATYRSGSYVTLSASPDIGNSFVSWGGDISGDNNPHQLIIDENKDITATFTESPPIVDDTVHIIICGNGGMHDDSVASAFRKGYLLSGSPFADSLQLRIESIENSLAYGYSKGCKLIVRSTTGLSSAIYYQNLYYPLQVIMPAGSNSYLQVYNSSGNLPAIISTGAGDLANETGYDIEFYSIDPIFNDEQDYSSFSNGYIAGAIYGIAKHTNGDIWTARYLLRQALGNSWTNTNGYGKITQSIVASAIALYDSEVNYDAIDPYN